MKTIAIIPARGGSKGVPRKNIKELAGKPLLYYTIKSALESDAIDEVMVSTEDEEIANIAKLLGANVPFLRPSNIAGDDATSLEVVKHVLHAYSLMKREFDMVCLLQPTSPCRPLGAIDKCINLLENSDADCVVSVRSVPHHLNPAWTFLMSENGHLRVSTGDKTVIARRQDLPHAVYRDGAIYVIKTSCVLSKDSLYGDSVIGYDMNSPEYVNIDTLEDWAIAEQLFQK